MSFGDLYQLPPGQDVAPGLPPIELPKTGAPAPQPLRVTVAPKPQMLPPIVVTPEPQPEALPAAPQGAQAADPFAAFPDAPASETKAPVPTPDGKPADPWGEFSDAPPKAAEKKPGREIPADEAASRGVVNALTFGFGPAIAGLAEASGMPSAAEKPDQIDINPVRPIVGAAKLLHGWLLDHPDPAVREAYDRGREAAMADERLASEQHPYAYVAGQLGGALASPGFGIGKAAATGGARLLAGAKAGTVAGGLYGAGEATSQGKSPLEVAKDAGKGAATGGVFGGAGAGISNVVGAGASKIASIVRGTRDVEAEAGRRVVNALRSDFETQGRRMGPDEIMAANAAGTPRAIMDTGGERTQALARSAANTSPEARSAINSVVEPRFEDQGTRIGGFIRQVTGGANAGADLAALESAAVAAKKPAYAKAYAAGDKPIWSPELERLASSPAVESAIGGAALRGKNRAVAEGMGGFNPSISVSPTGTVSFNKGPTGVPTYPNLQFWDYVQRELRDAANKAQRTGANEEAGAMFTLHKQLRAELDRLVPEFGQARSTAAAFFGAGDALEAGQKFVMQNANIGEARRALSKMSGPERELFARGFASDLADKIEKTGFSRDVLKSIFVNNGPAIEKIRLALGPQRAREVEALLRAEAVVDEARKALGNSSTVRQMMESGLAGGSAVAAFEGIKEHDFNPAHILAGALTVGAARHGAKVIDEKVARRVGEMLASNDPAILAKGIKIVTGSPVYFEALRRATAAGSRVAAYDVGPTRALAAAGAGAQGLVNRMNHPTEHSHDSLLDQAAQ